MSVGKAIRSALLTARHIAAPLTRAKGGAAQSQNAAPAPATPRPSKPNENEDEPLFDYSRLSETPKVPQADLPRYEPARGISDRVKDLIKKRGVKHKMLETIQHGLDKGGANWYNTDPLRDEFIKHLGLREGDAAHRQYMEFVAATSPRSEVGANARNASYYYHRHMSGQGMPAVGDKNPQPYGHLAQQLHQMNAQRVTTEGWDPLSNPKPASFVENLAGNQKPVAVDTHAFRLPAIHAQDPRFLETAYQSVKDAPRQNIQKLVESGDMDIKKALPAHWQSAPKDNEYGAMEKFYQGLAKELNITPAQAQAAAWVGGGKITGLVSDESKPFLHFLQDRVYKTAREVNMDPKDVLKDFITGKIPLRADGGPVGDGAATPLGPSAPSPAQVPVPSRGKPSIAPPVHQPRAFNGAGMYSHAVEQALALPQVRGAPQQMLASLKGVKKEELDNANPLQKFGGQRSVTREELADHFRHAMPRIHESEFNDYEPEDPDAPPNDTQYGDYTIPGGKNYRELLLHLPETKYDFNHPDIKAAAKRHTEASEAGHAYYRDHARAAPLWGSYKDMAAAGRDPIFEDPEYKRLQEEATQTNAAYFDTVMRHKNAAKEKDFYSDHWPTANVLAHLRLSDREGPVGGAKSPVWYRHVNKTSGYVGKAFPTMEALEQDAGKYPESVRKQLEVQPTAGPKEKITHLEELQSDWGQHGREKGFKSDLPAMVAKRDSMEDGEERQLLQAKINLAQQHGVPHGPYVTSTNGWTDLGLKRALLEAARNGSDRLAWTPGQEQADRFGLAKHYANLNWHRGFEYGTKPGEGTLVAYRHGQGGGAAPAVWQTMHEDELPEHIGAELAQRLLSQPEHKALEGVTSQRLEGDDLKVGGEGMKAFYDKIVPGRLKEILKKLGHEAKFEPLTITHPPKPQSWQDQLRDLAAQRQTPVGPLRTTLHSVHLPPELRDKIKKGLPTFAKGGAVKAPVTMRAAGVILRDPEDRVLFVKRNPKGGDHGGEWAFPGGKIERGETPAQAAVRETHEEIGHKIEGSLKQVDARVSKEGVHFTTFDHRVGKQFAPKLNEEHSEFRWAHPNSAPSPLHPGAKATLTKGPARAYAAGGGVHYDTHQDGPFWRVARREDGAHPSLQRRAGPEVRGPGGAPDGGAAGPVGDGGAQSPAARRLAQLQAVADRHAHSHGHGSVVDAGNSESSLHKQSAIGRAFQLAATDHPGYKRAVFAAYRRQHPELVREARARNYDELRHAAYTKLGHEVKQQFDDLPVRTSYHRHGEGDYESSKHMRHDVLENGHLNVFQGGDRHDFLHHVDPRTQLNENEMFRAIHDAYGHALHGSGFGAKGEERAWNAHRQMFSPLAALAMSAETRGQNSFVNYTPINAELIAAKHEKEAQIARAKRFGDAEAVKQHEKDKKDIMSGWKYAPQRAVLLPPEMVDPKYEGGMPDYLQHLIKPEPGTGLSSPITHFSPSPDVKELDPGRYGIGIKGDERARVLKRPGGVKERVYGYLGAPNQVKPEPGLGPYAYAGQANDLYDLTRDPVRLGLLATEANRSNPLGNFNPGVVNTAQAQNDTERMAKEHGYSGVANPKAAYPMAAVFGKVPVTPAAGSDVVDRALEMTRRRSTP